MRERLFVVDVEKSEKSIGRIQFFAHDKRDALRILKRDLPGMQEAFRHDRAAFAIDYRVLAIKER